MPSPWRRIWVYDAENGELLNEIVGPFVNSPNPTANDMFGMMASFGRTGHAVLRSMGTEGC